MNFPNSQTNNEQHQLFNFFKMKQLLTNYASYNLWANRRMAEMLSRLDDGAGDRPIVSSFPSVKQTVLHIWGAEWVWLQRLNGVSPRHFPSFGFEGGLQQAVDHWLETSGEFLGFVENTSEEFLLTTLDFTTLSSGPQSQRAFEMIHHCFNHSTYHRGQLVTMGRQLGLNEIPSTDFIFYLREK